MQTVPKVSPHAKSHQFTKKNISLYQDNSLSKAQRLKSLLTCDGDLFKTKEKNLIDQVVRRTKLKSRLMERNKIQEIVKFNLKEHKIQQELENNSAIRIQKHVRGFLIRKFYEQEITKIKKTYANQCFNSMHKTIYSLWIDLKYFTKVKNI